jgi:hypothetical protein
VAFVIFGLTVFGMVTNAAGGRAVNVSNCLSDTGQVLEDDNHDNIPNWNSYSANQTCLVSGPDLDCPATGAQAFQCTRNKAYSYN